MALFIHQDSTFAFNAKGDTIAAFKELALRDIDGLLRPFYTLNVNDLNLLATNKGQVKWQDSGGNDGPMPQRQVGTDTSVNGSVPMDRVPWTFPEIMPLFQLMIGAESGTPSNPVNPYTFFNTTQSIDVLVVATNAAGVKAVSGNPDNGVTLSPKDAKYTVPAELT